MATQTGERPASIHGIEPGTLYPLRAFKRLTGVGDWAFRTLRRRGLRVRRIAGKGFILDSDFIDLTDQESP